MNEVAVGDRIARLTAVSSVAMAVLIIVGVVTFMMWPLPSGRSVVEWFDAFRESWLRGMLDLDLVMFLSYLVLIPFVVGMYLLMKRSDAGLMTFAAASGLVAIATYFASSRLFEMVVLSQQYFATADPDSRATIIASGQSMLTTYLGSFAVAHESGGWNFQGTSFNVSYLLWSATAIMISIAMLRDARFARTAGIIGIAGNGLVLGLFLPDVGVIFSIAGLPLIMIWYVMIAVTLWRKRSQTA